MRDGQRLCCKYEFRKKSKWVGSFIDSTFSEPGEYTIYGSLLCFICYANDLVPFWPRVLADFALDFVPESYRLEYRSFNFASFCSDRLMDSKVNTGVSGKVSGQSFVS